MILTDLLLEVLPMKKDDILRAPLYLVMLLVGFPQISETIYSPALPMMAQWFGVCAGLIEMSLMTYFIGFSIGVGIWGRLSDLYGRRPMMLLGLSLYAVTCILLAHCHTTSALLILRAVQALGASVGSVITMTMIRDTLSGSERGRVFSLISGSLGFVPAVGPWLGSYLTAHSGWQSNFVGLAILGILLLVCCLLNLPETRTPSSKGNRNSSFAAVLKRMLKDTQLWGHILMIGACNGLLFGFYAEGPFLFIDQLGMETQQFGKLGLLISAGTLLAAGISYRLQGKTPAQSMIRYATLGTSAASILLLGFAVAGIIQPQMNSLLFITVLALLGCMFFGLSLIIPNSLSIALAEYQSDLGTAGALFGVGYYVLIALFMWLISSMHSGSPATLFQFNGLMAAVLTGGATLATKATAKMRIARSP